MQLALKNMANLSVPGSEIPAWFTPEVVFYSKPRNRVIKAVIVGLVISINHQTLDVLRDQLPVEADIQIRDDLRDQLPEVVDSKIKILRGNKPEPLYSTVPQWHPLILLLQEGDQIQVVRRNPPVVKGVQLKKCGIHLVFENDDDYDGEENWLHESQQSVSQKLAMFIGSSEEGSRILDNMSEGE
ncbi:hypothetical protein Vadar_007025 [Vaccinium darrowii]|uniref:Uncharacterized protein n=1 Tax=Vaccinium darrowii TaxID=229202 RepID=A0ACB7WYJ7_9ERIC|nr:hypothetical protein Vadar_007025 [Vaccinium darrowii]